MILLLGGTAETARLSAAIAEAGFEVLVSTATEIPLPLGNETGVSRRAGPLDVDAMVSLVRERGVRAIVDATHPYASGAHDTARQAAARANVPCLVFVRLASIREEDGVLTASGHEDAARFAASFGAPILLTIGSRNLLPYVRAAGVAGLLLFARVLPHRDSLEACRKAGLPDASVLVGRGPFTAEENRAAIRKHGIGVLVTKDGGAEGGVPAKIEAAREEGCRIVAVARPAHAVPAAFHRIPDLVEALHRSLAGPRMPPVLALPGNR